MAKKQTVKFFCGHPVFSYDLVAMPLVETGERQEREIPERDGDMDDGLTQTNDQQELEGARER